MRVSAITKALINGMRPAKSVLERAWRTNCLLRATGCALSSGRAHQGHPAKTFRITFGTLVSRSLQDAPATGPLAAYARLILDGKIQEDGYQVETLGKLQEVHLPLKWLLCSERHLLYSSSLQGCVTGQSRLVSSKAFEICLLALLQKTPFVLKAKQVLERPAWYSMTQV